MNSLINVMTKFGLLKEDLDYHLVRASMVIVFFFFGYQIVALSLKHNEMKSCSDYCFDLMGADDIRLLQRKKEKPT